MSGTGEINRTFEKDQGLKNGLLGEKVMLGMGQEKKQKYEVNFVP